MVEPGRSPLSFHPGPQGEEALPRPGQHLLCGPRAEQVGLTGKRFDDFDKQSGEFRWRGPQAPGCSGWTTVPPAVRNRAVVEMAARRVGPQGNRQRIGEGAARHAQRFKQALCGQFAKRPLVDLLEQQLADRGAAAGIAFLCAGQGIHEH